MPEPNVPRRGPCEVLDEAKREQVLTIVANGGSRRSAARYVRCSPGTLSRTLARDPEFADRMAHAEEGLEIRALATIRRAAGETKYWRAAAWVLERKNAAEYAPRRPRTFTGQQVCEVVSQMAEIVMDDVPSQYWGRIIERLGHLLAEFQDDDGRAEELDSLPSSPSGPSAESPRLPGAEGAAGR